MQLSQSAAVNK